MVLAPHPSLPKVTAAVPLALLTLAVLTGCSNTTPEMSTVLSANPTPRPASTDVLFTATYHGGLCAEGPCSSTLTVRADGTWAYTPSNTVVPAAGELTPALTQQAHEAVSSTGILTAPAFTGTCPTAYDGQAVTYTWTDPATSRTHTVDSCDKAIPVNDPLAQTAYQIRSIVIKKLTVDDHVE